jgi:phytoene dehydrogenase-like protein
LWSDRTRATNEVAAFSPRDADRYPLFLASVAAIGSVLDTVLSSPPPLIDKPGLGDLVTAIKAGRAFRSLAKPDAYRLLRWLTMPVQDLVGEWFESEPLSVALAATGTFGAFLGPRSAGSGAQLLLLGAGETGPFAPGWIVRGGMSALADALEAAAHHAGVETRTNSDVREIVVREGSAAAVVLANGDEFAARYVVSCADPKRTLLGLVDPVHLGPETIRRTQNIRMRGTLAKVNYAVSGLPAFDGLSSLPVESRRAALSGCVRLAEDLDTLERAFDSARRGDIAESLWLELAIPSAVDESLAPPGQHVVSVYVQYAPFTLTGRTWDDERERLGDLTTRRIETFAPGFERSLIAREVITPLDLERTYGLTGGHIFHGDLALDQLVSARPFLGWTAYESPVRNLYVCGSGVHPGTGLDGRAGLLAARAVARAKRAIPSPTPARQP